SRRGLGGVGRAHHLAEPRDDVVAFEHHHQGLPRAHEGRQAFEKSFAAMHGVEAFGFALAESHQTCGDDLETVRLKDFDDVAHVPVADGVGLDDGERSLDRQFHLLFSLQPSAFTLCTFRACAMVSPISAGLAAILIPAASSAPILSAAAPLPPEMMAPACPMRRPGGAVRPAMNPTTGFRTFALVNAAASSSAVPPISPIMTMPCVSGSSFIRRSASMKLVPIIGSPPMPMQVDCPMPSPVSWPTASYVSVPPLDMTPT